MLYPPLRGNVAMATMERRTLSTGMAVLVMRLLPRRQVRFVIPSQRSFAGHRPSQRHDGRLEIKGVHERIALASRRVLSGNQSMRDHLHGKDLESIRHRHCSLLPSPGETLQRHAFHSCSKGPVVADAERNIEIVTWH